MKVRRAENRLAEIDDDILLGEKTEADRAALKAELAVLKGQSSK